MATALNKETASRRLEALHAALLSGQFALSKSLVVLVGKTEEDTYSKSNALQIFLAGYVLPETLICVTQDKVLFLSSQKKLAFLQPLKDSTDARAFDVEMLERNKANNDKDNFETVLKAIRASGGKLAVFPDKSGDDDKGDFYKGWMDTLKSSGLQTVDATVGASKLLAVKEAGEIESMRSASLLSALVMHKGARKRIVETFDSDIKVKHSKFSEDLEKDITDGPHAAKAKLSADDVDSCYTPIVQSGGKFNLKVSAISDDNILKSGVVVVSLGAKYKSYCSNISRTYIIQPTEQQTKDYNFLLEVQAAAVKLLKPGARCGQVYESTKAFVADKRPDLVQYFVPNIGCLIGIEFRDSQYALKAGVDTEIKAGMAFNLAVGFQDIPDTDSGTAPVFSLLVADTVVVNEEGDNEELTASARRDFEGIHFKFEDEDEVEEVTTIKPDELEPKKKRAATANLSVEQKRAFHQLELTKKLEEETRRRLDEGTMTAAAPTRNKDNIAYKSVDKLPADECRKLRIFIDKTYEAVILPIFGMAVPFHISMIKNVSITDQNEDTSYLRINFNTPGVTVARATLNADSEKELIYLKEISFKSQSVAGLNNAFRMIKDLQKRYKQTEADRKEMEDLVEQEDLVLRKTDKRIVLRDLMIRPSLAKKGTGTLEAHMNGFRFTNRFNESVDILYTNIKHAFYQPCKGEVVIMFHFHLKNPIMIGKKKYKDITVFSEVGETVFDLGGANRGTSEREEIESEQRERMIRHKISQMFEGFLKKVEEVTNQAVEFDMPFPDLAFNGVPHRTTVKLQPTTYCLINVIEIPPFVLTLSEVERVHFERATFMNKNFDMVFVFRDYSRDPISITSVDMKQIESIKDWLDSCDIKYTSGPMNLNWRQIMKAIRDDFEGFVNGAGGWSILEQEDSEDEDGGESSESSYAPSGSEEEESSEDDYTSEDSDEESGSEEDSEEESGMDWDDLEAEAREEDRQANMRDADEEDSPKKKKKPVSSSSAAPKRMQQKQGGMDKKKSRKEYD